MNQTPEKPIYYNLTNLAVVRVDGNDASHFLQGQLSNDISHLSKNSSHQLSAYCNPKGRMLALFHVLKLGSAYVLIAPREIMDKTLPRLRMFVMRAAVEIKSYDDVTLMGMRAPGIGDGALADLHKRCKHVAKHRNDPDRFFLLITENIGDGLKDANEWNRLDIEQGLPQVYLQTYETLIPQSVNLDIIGGVNFRKGCYPGQEIIARVKYRGKPKTRMIGVKTSRSESVHIGTPIYIEGRESSAGQVINIAHQGHETRLSISVPVTHIKNSAVYLETDRTAPLERLPLPYEITI